MLSISKRYLAFERRDRDEMYRGADSQNVRYFLIKQVKLIRCLTGSQWNCVRIGMIWQCLIRLTEAGTELVRAIGCYTQNWQVATSKKSHIYWECGIGIEKRACAWTWLGVGTGVGLCVGIGAGVKY